MVRTYATDLIPDTCPAVKSNDDGYEPDTEQEMALELETREDDEEDDEDSETPKKKMKGVKQKVRDLIDLAKQKAQEDMEVRCLHYWKY